MANSRSSGSAVESKLRKYRHLYGRNEEDREKEVQYDVAKIILQDEVAGVRRIATLTWNYIKVSHRQLYINLGLDV